MKILENQMKEKVGVNDGVRSKQNCNTPRGITISYKTYIKNLTSYSFVDFKIVPEHRCVYEEIKKDFEFQNRTNKINFEYFFVDQKFLINELHCPEDTIIDLLLNLIVLLDYPEDKFLLFKELYSKKSAFYVKISKTLRNLEMFPINEEERIKSKEFEEQLDLLCLFKIF